MIVSSSSPAQEKRINFLRALAETAWSAWATRVLPVPVSPSISTWPSACPRSKISSRNRSMTPLAPTSLSIMELPEESSRRSCRLSKTRRRARVAFLAKSVIVSGLKGFSKKSKAPMRMASTAMGTSPCPVIMITGRLLSMPLTFRRNCIPSMPGILMSVTMIPG